MPKRRSVEGEYRVEGSALDELGLDRLPTAAEAGFPFSGAFTARVNSCPSRAWRAFGFVLRRGLFSAYLCG
jgi:hypothetical protein